jgi:hypothetical protein
VGRNLDTSFAGRVANEVVTFGVLLAGALMWVVLSLRNAVVASGATATDAEQKAGMAGVALAAAAIAGEHPVIEHLLGLLPRLLGAAR